MLAVRVHSKAVNHPLFRRIRTGREFAQLIFCSANGHRVLDGELNGGRPWRG